MWSGGITASLFAASPLLLPSVGLAAAVENHEPGNVVAQASATPRTGIPPCDALIAAGLGDRLVAATEEGYEARIATYWSVSARLRPWCLFQPRDTEEVSRTLTTLVKAGSGTGDWHMAVRGGGHNHWAGTNNIANGVTIDLAHFNQTSYNPRTNLASVGPGDHWKDVFAALLKHNVTVAGGRDGGVGVGGFLLGGGNSYYTGRMGFGADSVRNYEVVLADGAVVHANDRTNPDLYKALKGGGGNFGIVTRFDMEALPAKDLYTGIRLMSKENSDDVVDAVVDFTNHDQSLADDAMVVVYTHNTAMGDDVLIAASRVNTQGNSNTTAFAKINRIPAISSEMTHRSMADLALNSQIPAGSRSVWFTLTFKNDASILRRAVDAHQAFVDAMKQAVGADEFTTQMVFQPLPTYFAEIGRARGGGNVLGLDAETDNAILWLGLVTVNTEAQEAVARARMASAAAQIEGFAASAGGDVDWRYLNYADPSQNPLKTYGEANVDFIRKVASKYDPEGVFQKRIPGGFKISRVD
ncbi:FAD binding domain-containing protein [Colletotrichum higginsianum IMI 349063]|uniref:FAD binding domain-containing protein n=1 Tax=Colletotrichum higginsianum (strain IMI 349063) TaxID=759273 RepID=A0A1B7Y994_COLHI|nr:FAD binding domain-containing protein [Colletotrichum higginsianum IMI 349063]OBR08505.1 FAD binding domain-containing protein [Colletotrichum higginsianum IMI 349063]